MKLEQCGNNLAIEMSKLSLEEFSSRETGLIDAPPMNWRDLKTKVGEEFKHIYNSRLDKMNDRWEKKWQGKIMPISSVVEDRDNYCIKGIIKRLEFIRTRAF